MEELAKRQPMIRKRLAEIAEGATIRAVEAAQDNTPPNTFEDDEIRGVHTITGDLSEHWATDSQVIPAQSGGDFTTTLQNDKDYASYVNDGHDVDEHFVPGLYIDDEGILSFDPAEAAKSKPKFGLKVGTKTKSVEGLHMKEKAIDKFKEVAEIELPRVAKEAFR